MDIPEVRESLTQRSKRIKGHLALRRGAVRFLQYNKALHELDSFQENKKIIERKEGWLNYLKRMKQDGEWADDFIIWCTALFLGKNILSAGDTNGKDAPWTLVPGYRDNTVFESTLPPLTVAYLSQRHYEPIESQTNEPLECLGCGMRVKQSILRHLSNKATDKKLCTLFYDKESIHYRC